MGRNKYTVEERDNILKTFIKYTREIMEKDGLDAVSTRKLAALTGFNSAKLYFYFKNIDDLVALACVSHTENYCKMLAGVDRENMDSEAYLYRAWEIFCNCALDEPEIYTKLFFTKRETKLGDVMNEYYRLYPAEFEKLDEKTREMLKEGCIFACSDKVLQPLVDKGLIKVDKLPIVSELLISFMGKLLWERMQSNQGEEQKAEMTKRFLDALKFMLESLGV